MNPDNVPAPFDWRKGLAAREPTAEELRVLMAPYARQVVDLRAQLKRAKHIIGVLTTRLSEAQFELGAVMKQAAIWKEYHDRYVDLTR